MKANGTSRPKVFKLDRVTLPARGRIGLKGSVNLAQLTTRRVYPGRHAIELLVNGTALPLAELRVLRERAGSPTNRA